ncbi:unnamed protein product [Caenorhabditis angaria]|uniref:N-acetylphosphatidylethanolamine-hydrolyzing phospholipase D n=1 Tax=Caenorhabditis angaria TaxID=860376 RepID=A0A9P1IRN7_9PELO|nr:unnamed protein product [Caenorhabditis angaria]
MRFFLLIFLVLMESSSQEKNSTEESGFATPLRHGKTFANPPSFKNWGGLPGPREGFRYKFLETDNENVPKNAEELDETIPIKNLTKFESKSKLFASWLGHATVLLNIEGATVITDPIWAQRASFISFVGPKRYRPPPMKIEDLPKLDYGVISHDHYDHLDYEAVKKITEMNPSIRWFVPLGMKSWMESAGITKLSPSNADLITEMNWGESVRLEKDGKNFEIWCVPAQRGPFDRNHRLWSGWSVVGPTKRFYYSGDTGFCESEFRKIGDKLGPFDLAAIPIGAYEPKWFMKSQHINPEEAVSVHELIKSRMSIGIHWGTYHMGSYEHYLEPRDKLKTLMENREDLKHTKFITITPGEIWEDN